MVREYDFIEGKVVMEMVDNVGDFRQPVIVNDTIVRETNRKGGFFRRRQTTTKDTIYRATTILNADSLPNGSVREAKYIVNAGTKFTAYELRDGSKLLVKFWKYTTRPSPKPESTGKGPIYQYISKETNGNYFLMDLEDFNKKTSEFHGKKHSLAWGFSTIPIKLRFGGGDRTFQYNTGFSLGMNVGYERQFQSRLKQSIGLLLGAGISTVGVDPESVNNYIDKSATVGAFTPSLGLVYTLESFQVGVFTGIDYIQGEMGKN